MPNKDISQEELVRRCLEVDGGIIIAAKEILERNHPGQNYPMFVRPYAVESLVYQDRSVTVKSLVHEAEQIRKNYNPRRSPFLIGAVA